MNVDKYSIFLRRIPKVDLHVHLTGTIRMETFRELALRESLDLPDTVENIYSSINSQVNDLSLYRAAVIPVPSSYESEGPGPFYSLLQVTEWVQSVLRYPEDFSRIVFEALEDGFRHSNTIHTELFFDQVPAENELGYAAMVEALVDGLKRAEVTFGVTARLIAGLDRSNSPERVLARVRTVVDNPHSYVVGIGLDNLETLGPPAGFRSAYKLAGSSGLFRTAHASEHAPTARNTITCLDDLGCDRIDHGYFMLQDDGVVDRCVSEQVPVTCIFSTSRRAWQDWRKASSTEMLRRGIKVCLASDDPGMFPTTLAEQYRMAGLELGWSYEEILAVTQNSVDASWIPETDRAALQKRMEGEIDALELDLESSKN